MFEPYISEFNESVDLENDTNGEPLIYQLYYQDPLSESEIRISSEFDEYNQGDYNDEIEDDPDLISDESDFLAGYPTAISTDYKCSCGIKLGFCKSIDHPRLLAEETFNYVEGWALGKYAQRKGKFGKLIYDYKYRKYESEELHDQVSFRISEYINSVVTYFFEKHWVNGQLPFEYIYAVPGSTGAFPSIGNEISSYLETRGLQPLPEFIEINRNFSTGAKDVVSREEKEKYLSSVMQWNSFVNLPRMPSVLIIDDVIGTGATLNRVAKILKKVRPESRLYYLCVAYL